MKKILDFLVTAGFIVVLAFAGAVFLVEWFAGCGETYIAADGHRYPHECLLIR